jgi:hypothetical protein
VPWGGSFTSEKLSKTAAFRPRFGTNIALLKWENRKEAFMATTTAMGTSTNRMSRTAGYWWAALGIIFVALLVYFMARPTMNDTYSISPASQGVIEQPTAQPGTTTLPSAQHQSPGATGDVRANLPGSGPQQPAGTDHQ